MPYSARRSSVHWALAALIPATVLAFDPAGFAPFGPIKWTVVTSLTLVLATTALGSGRLEIERSSGFAWVVFLAWGVLASLFAVDRIHTWIGTPDRHLGLAAWALFAIAFFGGQAAREPAGVRLVVRAFTIALAGLGVYSVFELIGLAPVDLAFDFDRLGGPFGSPAYLGAAAVLLIPIVLGWAVAELDSTAWRAAAFVAGALGVIALLGSQTRAAWLGLLVAAAVVVPSATGWLRKHAAPIGVVALIGGLLFALTPVGDRGGTIFDSDGGARSRIDEWQVATGVIASHPIAGVGFEGYRIAFPESVDADYERRYRRVVTPDRAHNSVLDVAATMGIPGAALFGLAMAWLVARALSGVRSRDPWLVGLSAGVVGYIAQQLFLFPIAEVDPVFWAAAGVVVAATNGQARTAVIRPRKGLLLIPLLLTGMVLVAGVLDIAADHTARSALEASAQGRGEVAIAEADRAIDLRPDSIRYGFVAATVAAKPGTVEGLGVAIDRIDATLDVSPRDPILLATRAGFLLDMARLTGASTDFEAARTSWRSLSTGDPNNAQYRLEFGIALAASGDLEGAEAEWIATADLAPTSAVPWTNLAALYLETDRYDDASSALDSAAALDPANPALAVIREQLNEAVRSENAAS